MHPVAGGAAELGRLVNRPQAWDFAGARALYAGVDVGTFKTIAVVVDEAGRPRAAVMRRAPVVESGLIVDYLGACGLVGRIMEEIRTASPLPVETGATSYPPNTESANRHTTRHVLESAGLEVAAVPDEPTAAALALGMQEGVIVDVGGGTTGVALVRGGRVAASDDEPTGGHHLTLVLAGRLGIDYEAAEQLKADPLAAGRVLPIVTPVIEKIAAIVEGFAAPREAAGPVALVGGTCALAGLAEVVARRLGRTVARPPEPQLITPLGIALAALPAEARAAAA